MFGRTRRGKAVPDGQWYWPDQRTHPAIVDREVWEAAQQVGAEHRSSRDGAPHNPATWRAYPFRSRIRCKICKRRMCGLTKVHAQNKTPTEYAYYVCQYNPRTPSHVAAAPDHPRTVQVREDVLMAETFRGLAAYALAPGRERRLAELIPHTATARQQQHDRQAAALAKRLKRLTARQDNLMRELNESFDMADEAGEAYRRRIRTDYASLHGERKDIETQLTELAADATPAPAPDLVSLLPEVTADLTSLQTELFEVFDIQIIWNAPMRQATFRATITDTTPSIVTAQHRDRPAHPRRRRPRHPGSSHAHHQHRHQPRTIAGIHTHPYTAQNSAHKPGCAG